MSLECSICWVRSILQGECGNKNGYLHGWQVKLLVAVLCSELPLPPLAYGAFSPTSFAQVADNYQVVVHFPPHLWPLSFLS